MVKTIDNSTSGNCSYGNNSLTESGKTTNGRKASFIIPESHSSDKDLKIVAICLAVALVAGIVLWSVGVSLPLAGLILSGKMVFGLSMSAVGIVAIGYLLYIACH